MQDSVDAKMVIDALQMAIGQRRPRPGLIVHSDRGTQYASGTYRAALSKHRLVPSMSRKGNCYDNAYIEPVPTSPVFESRV